MVSKLELCMVEPKSNQPKFYFYYYFGGKGGGVAKKNTWYSLFYQTYKMGKLKDLPQQLYLCIEQDLGTILKEQHLRNCT